MKKNKKHTCPDCGAAPTNHTVAWLSVFLREYLSPFERVALPKFSPAFMERFSLGLMRVFQFLRLGKTTYLPIEEDSWRTKALWGEALKRDITMEEFHFLNIGQEMFCAKKDGITRCFDGLPRPYGEASESLEWMDNKAEMRKRFAAAGIPIAKGGVARTRKEADTLFDSLEKPIIVKPKIGSRSRHTTTAIFNREMFHRACERAHKLSPWIIIEEELSGPVFRATLVGGKTVAVMRRDPAAVIGDGVHTVSELTETENARPERQGPLFHHVPTEEDAGATNILSEQGLRWDSVPSKGKIVLLGRKTSRGVGGATTDVTDDVHVDNRELFDAVARVLNDSLVGIDFIMEDISCSWKVQKKAGILECNSLPFIDLHHYPLNGRSHNIAAALWDLIYPNSRTDR